MPRFCEACGASVGSDPEAAPDVGCERCGSAVAADGYCTSCGHRALEPVDVEDIGTAAFATHRGRRHHRNEDAGALGSTADGRPVLVVVDGVSNSPNPHLAAAAATAAALDHLTQRSFEGPDDLAAAVAAAHEAACAAPAEGDPHWTADGSAPACTIVIGVVADHVFHFANVGDARGYHLHPDGDAWTATAITTDDSLVAQAVAAGIDAKKALALPGGHAITAWLGRDAPAPAPHLCSQPAADGDVLLLCSDGLWNYAPIDAEMSAVLSAELGAGWPDALGAAVRAARLVGERPGRRRQHLRRRDPTGGTMSDAPFSAETFQNEYLAADADTVDAVVSVTAAGDPSTAGRVHDERR